MNIGNPRSNEYVSVKKTFHWNAFAFGFSSTCVYNIETTYPGDK